MAIIPTVGRKALRVRLVICMIYLVLVLLGTTMVLPFLITLSSSTTNDYDYDRFSPIPRYLFSDEDRFLKGLVGYFNTYGKWYHQFRAALTDVPQHWTSWQVIGRDKENCLRVARKYLQVPDDELRRWRVIAADYSHFADHYPMADSVCPVNDTHAGLFLQRRYSHLAEQQNPDLAKSLFRRKVRAKALDMLNQKWGVHFLSFFAVGFGGSEMASPIWQQSWFPKHSSSLEDFLYVKLAYKNHYFTPGVRRKWLRLLGYDGYRYKNETEVWPVQENSPPELQTLWVSFKSRVAPASPVTPYALRAVWYVYLTEGEEAQELAGLKQTETFDVAVYNRLAGTNYTTIEKTPFPVPPDLGPGIQKIWQQFVFSRYPLRLTRIRVTPALQTQYEAFLRKEYKTVKNLNRLVGTQHADWSDFRLSASPPDGVKHEDLRSVWGDFAKMLPIENRVLHSSEKTYQEYLLAKYGDMDTINKTYGWQLTRMEEAFPRVDIAYTITFRENKTAFALRPILSNYRIISSFLLTNSNAVWVTLLLVTLAVGFTLTVNPVAAYALSRFNLRGQDKVLLFMLATMAFPAMVSAIPAYLLMRDLGLLNTFFALVLPGAANGMAIFILKGFFDSLPSELYEAATIDGAKEWQIFLIVTLPMVKPILAINALTAFIAAYNGWQWALIICQKQSMWTIAVWLYQANSWWVKTPWIVTAGFVVASIPTLIVFLSCQKIILRGIIIPSMK